MLLLLFCTLFFSVTQLKSLIPIHLDQVDTRVSLCGCIVEATKKYFNSDFEIITYILPSVEVSSNISSFFVISNFVLGRLQNHDQWTLLIKNVNYDTNTFNKHPRKPSSYIIQFRQRGEFAKNMKRLKLSLSWNPHAKFLIVSPTLFSNPEDVAKEITEVLWKQHVLDAAILLNDPNNTTNFNVYSWEPYSEKSCGDDFSNTFPIDSCSYGIAEFNTDWYNSKISNNFNNCTLKVAFTIWPPFVTTSKPVFEKSDLQATQGIEVNLLNMIAEYLNLFVTYLESTEDTWSAVYDNGTTTGDLTLLANDEIDLVLGGYMKTYTRALYFDCSRSYIQETLEWCVPHDPILFGLKPMINILSKEIWIGLAFIYVTVSLISWGLAKQSKREVSVYIILGNVLLNNFLILIGFAANILPRSKGVRFFIGIFIIFSLHLNILYTSYLTSTLSSHSFKEKYNKIETIYNSKLNTYFIPASIHYFMPYDNEENYIQGIPLSVILQNWRDCYNVTFCIEEILEGKPNAFCLPNLYKEYLFSQLGSFYRRKHQIYCLNEQVVNFPINLIMRKGFPLYEPFQKFIDRISNAGFISKWEKDLLYQKKENIIYDREMLKELVAIKFGNLVVIFECLLVAHILCILVFVGELIVRRKH